MSKRIPAVLALVALLGGCSLFRGKEGHRPKTAVLGERIPVLASESDATIEPTIAEIPVAVPEPQVNDSWSQPGGNASKSMGNPSLAPALRPE